MSEIASIWLNQTFYVRRKNTPLTIHKIQTFSLSFISHFSEGNTGPVDGIDYVGSVNAEFTKLKKRPEVGRWIQATTTTIARYIFTERDDLRMSNNGFMLKYVTESGEDASHFVSFDSPELADEEFRPFMDICYVPCKSFSNFILFQSIFLSSRNQTQTMTPRQKPSTQ